MFDAVLPAHPIDSTLTGAGSEPASEHLAVGQDLIGHAVAAHRQRQSVAHRTRRRPRHHEGGDHEAAVVVDARDDLGLTAVDQPHRPTTSICHSSIARQRSQRL
jgi:hypothetical protein